MVNSVEAVCFRIPNRHSGAGRAWAIGFTVAALMTSGCLSEPAGAPPRAENPFPDLPSMSTDDTNNRTAWHNSSVWFRDAYHIEDPIVGVARSKGAALEFEIASVDVARVRATMTWQPQATSGERLLITDRSGSDLAEGASPLIVDVAPDLLERHENATEVRLLLWLNDYAAFTPEMEVMVESQAWFGQG